MRPGSLWRRFSDFVRAEDGLIALKFALALPAVALLVAGSIDLMAVNSARNRLQDIADAAALAGARDLNLAVADDTGIERAKAYVDEALSRWEQAPAVSQTIEIEEADRQRILVVVLNGHRMSFFGNLLPPGGWKFVAISRATSVGRMPLCVLGIGNGGQTVISVADQSRLSAPNCMVHSNRDVEAGGSIQAGAVQAVTSASGLISPKPGVGAAPIEDPFAAMNLDESGACGQAPSVQVYSSGLIYAHPGVHCGGYKLMGSARLMLHPGEHWFLGGHLDLSENAVVQGSDVALFFDKKSKFDFKGQSSVRLSGRRTGAYAGMVVAATRGNTQTFTISSDNVDTLLGVIYVPEATLLVEGKSEVARDSAWTVVVARWLDLKGSASLVINANYDSSSVPVPDGVGPTAGGAKLID